MTIDWTKHFEQYRGQWIALKDDEVTVVGSGETARKALDAAKEAGFEKPILTKMPSQLATYVGHVRA